ncbi:hypothetical protein [Limnohabitans sp. Jir72]|uniref:hypothetical protein n=1 Tax=Limnohabitans sp. Jir72 TaxID=1977909 RepID=UPI000D343623|nr:hypothetical protein [Limnohabitans sp. Jir72]PUE35783.1 hypothetical protein B9Z52_00965 [Limnohabitans sp. Jir72]
MTYASVARALSDVPPQTIPVLTREISAKDIPQPLLLALEARQAERAMILGLSQELMLSLRPELDRMAAELAQRSVEGMWAKRAEIYKTSSSTAI